MRFTKDVWVNHQGAEVYTVTVESAHTDRRHCVRYREMFFPVEPTPEHPARHTVVMGGFTKDDLREIAHAILSVIGEDGS